MTGKSDAFIHVPECINAESLTVW